MKTIQALAVSVALAIGMAAPASAGVNDPEVIIYRFPGVRDSGTGPALGVATLFFCTNFSGATENIRLVTRGETGSLLQNNVFLIGHLFTRTFATHLVAAYTSNDLSTSAVDPGTTAIAATSTNIICTAMTIDAANVRPVGVALRGIRFSPVPGSEE